MTNVKPRREIMERYVAEAEGLAARNGGRVPHVQWLRHNDYTNLYQYMRAHQRAFRHLPQDKKGGRSFDQKARDRQVGEADKLAARNNGNLPSVSRLMKKKKTGLLSYINKHPHFFAHIPQDRKHSTKEEHVASAEKLAKENNGCLPGGGTIVDRGGWALYKYMKRNPTLFLHICGANSFLASTCNGKTKNGNSTNGAGKTSHIGSKTCKE